MIKYYVSTTDTFMSGWGCADGKINKLIFECDSLKQAEIVADNARNRKDQKSIRIHVSKPYFQSGQYYVQDKTIEEYGAWYEEGYFAERTVKDV